jgi:hypothetical protein
MYRTAVIAYSDDITTILRFPKDAAIVQKEISKYEAASRAKLNINTFLERCTKHSGDTISSGSARPRYTRYPDRPPFRCHQLGDGNGQNKTPGDGCILQRSQLKPTDTVRKTYLMAKAWYMAQFTPTPHRLFTANKHDSVMVDMAFRVALSTLYKRKEHGGWALTHVAAKCRALLLYRLWL